ncbi:MAG: hypothetical protein KDB48_04705 [Solirubrobacterales bacterium]|nr:hypothetical protein [Solirubrobacterales bacterium]HMT05900.1 hypothetical protein [Solirubrobacterales bacterium]
MRRFRKAPKKEAPETSPEDTREMFTAGEALPANSGESQESEPATDETREYETVTLAREDGPEGVESAGREEADRDEGDEGEDAEEGWDEGENETWDDDEDEEWVEFEDDTDLEDDPGKDDGPEPESDAGSDVSKDGDLLAGLKSWFSRLWKRSVLFWSGLLKRVGETKLPRHEIDGQKVLAGAGIAAVALLIAAGGYLLGKGSGDNLDTARLEGEFAGRKAGAVAGATKGYAAGFKKGRDLAFERSYSTSYRRNYRRAYENAGMDPPKAASIEVPEP